MLPTKGFSSGGFNFVPPNGQREQRQRYSKIDLTLDFIISIIDICWSERGDDTCVSVKLQRNAPVAEDLSLSVATGGN